MTEETTPIDGRPESVAPDPFAFDGEGAGSAVSSAADTSLADRVLDALKTVYDPEIPVNIVELGLIYDLDIAVGGKVKIEMTLTAPGCPVAGTMPGQVADAARGVDGVTDVEVELVWSPPWSPELMTEEARLELGMM